MENTWSNSGDPSRVLGGELLSPAIGEEKPKVRGTHFSVETRRTTGNPHALPGAAEMYAPPPEGQCGDVVDPTRKGAEDATTAGVDGHHTLSRWMVLDTQGEASVEQLDSVGHPGGSPHVLPYSS